MSSRRHFMKQAALLAGAAQLWSLLGDLPERDVPTATLKKTEKHPGFTLEYLDLLLNGLQTVPSLLKHFQTREINKRIVPRPRIGLNGRADGLAAPEGVLRVRDHLLPHYEKHGKLENCHIALFDCGHEELPAIREQNERWLDTHLVAGGRVGA